MTAFQLDWHREGNGMARLRKQFRRRWVVATGHAQWDEED